MREKRAEKSFVPRRIVVIFKRKSQPNMANLFSALFGSMLQATNSASDRFCQRPENKLSRELIKINHLQEALISHPNAVLDLWSNFPRFALFCSAWVEGKTKANDTRTGEEEESIKRLFSSSSAVSAGDSSYRFRSVVRETRQVIVNYIQLWWLDLPAPEFLSSPLDEACEEAKVSYFFRFR